MLTLLAASEAVQENIGYILLHRSLGRFLFRKLPGLGLRFSGTNNLLIAERQHLITSI